MFSTWLPLSDELETSLVVIAELDSPDVDELVAMYPLGPSLMLS